MDTNQHIVVGNQTQPSGQIGSAVSLSYIVANIQNELDDYSPALYKRAMQIVIDGVREIRLYHQSSLQVGYFTIPDSGVLNFPPDYLNYTKIGIPINGQMVTLTVNENMLLNRAKSCGEDIRTMKYGGAFPAFTDGYYFAPHYNNGMYVGGLYGAGGGFNTAYYREDKVARQFQFDGIIPYIGDNRMIVMEYESTGISQGTLVSAECIEPLKNWYFWKSSRHNPNVPQSRAQAYKEDYEHSITKMRAYDQQFTLSEYLDLLYQNYKQSPKI